MTDGKDGKDPKTQTWTFYSENWEDSKNWEDLRTWNMGSEPMPKDFPREMALKILRRDLKKIERRKAKKDRPPV